MSNLTTNITPTQSVLIEMLRENTGSHFLDSGGVYGRNWEKNQNVDFNSAPESTVNFELSQDDDIWINVTHDLYHWLSKVLEYVPEQDKQFQEYLDAAPAERGYMALMEDWPHIFLRDIAPGGLHGDSSGPMTVNTYNHESLLSQVIQYVYWTNPETDEEWIVLQIHNGCDVRGGYTRPRMFKTGIEGDPPNILDNSRYGITCDHCSAIWSDNGGEWNGSEYMSHCVPDFSEIKGIEGNQNDALKFCTDTLNNTSSAQNEKLIDIPQTKPAELPEGTKLVIDENGQAFCPVCGTGKLSSYFY